jgi:hypothetical protein
MPETERRKIPQIGARVKVTPMWGRISGVMSDALAGPEHFAGPGGSDIAGPAAQFEVDRFCSSTI